MTPLCRALRLFRMEFAKLSAIIRTCRIRNVILENATESGEGDRALSVEECNCPIGTVGHSCDGCASGYWK